MIRLLKIRLPDKKHDWAFGIEIKEGCRMKSMIRVLKIRLPDKKHNQSFENEVREGQRRGCQMKSITELLKMRLPNKKHNWAFGIETKSMIRLLKIRVIGWLPDEKYDRTFENKWAIQKVQFPNVAKLARKYLSIPGSSVPSERLFSDTGNQITAKHTCLDSKLVEL
ncbi:hypothetical protein RclHR1_13180004 [Rhizophagus clarus]|uniref:HAT C-terminal dimerisation domain-containing protein n=1 Tax=Rhizophagus clarus TaxID=94130 RepID=A0A2Z6QPW0_9GLOM|nr:hypothetical protein RclHR1_13180004 [Rhizophagus clarus]